MGIRTLHVINIFFGIFCIRSLTNTLFFRQCAGYALSLCSAAIVCMGMPPAKWKAEVVWEGLARLLITGSPKTRLGQVDAAEVWGDAEWGAPAWVSMHQSQEWFFCGWYTAVMPFSRRDPCNAVKPPATAGVCRYLQLMPGKTKPSQCGILKPNRPGFVIAQSAYAGRQEQLI